MKRKNMNRDQNREGAAESWPERPAPFPIPWSTLMRTLNDIAAQLWNDPAKLSEFLDAQPILAAYLADGMQPPGVGMHEYSNLVALQKRQPLSADGFWLANCEILLLTALFRRMDIHSMATPRQLGDSYFVIPVRGR